MNPKGTPLTAALGLTIMSAITAQPGNIQTVATQAQSPVMLESQIHSLSNRITALEATVAI